MRGVTDLAVSASLGQPTIRIDIDRAKAARYGLAPGDINATVQAAIGGQAAGDLYETAATATSRWSCGWRRATARTSRRSGASRSARRPQAASTQVPLAEVANVELVSGAFYIYREQQARYVPVKFSVRGRDLGSAVLEAQQRVAEKVKIPRRLPARMGRASSATSGAPSQRLSIAVPIAIALILLLLYVSFGTLARHVAALAARSRWR